jgi:hypothetical protein
MGDTSETVVREVTEADWPRVWALFREVTAAGDAFAYDESTTDEMARKLWFDPPAACFVCKDGCGRGRSAASRSWAGCLARSGTRNWGRSMPSCVPGAVRRGRPATS